MCLRLFLKAYKSRLTTSLPPPFVNFLQSPLSVQLSSTSHQCKSIMQILSALTIFVLLGAAHAVSDV